MQTIHVNYSITVSDFRKATYYGLFLRHRRALQIMFLVLGVSILYAIGGALGLGTVNYLVFFLALAYLIWGIFLFAGAEKGIRQYLASPHNTLGCDYDVTIDAHRIRICIPSHKGDSSFLITKLACVYELSSMYLLYVNTQEVYLLPKRALTAEQVSELRALLQTRKKAKPTSRSASPFVAFTNFHLLPQILFRQALMGNHSLSRQMSASISLVILSSISRIKS